ncbi:hypothetical protein PLESTB_000925100 [Pleodorina starrii]|uniref:Protein Asterix n=1 Tax=Pleodorina starrii TaxID=330485 RepID=A0A9W6F3Z5_9CHLO|nr:hypothetical protein PLESTM_001560100 [Pleodorina starrii]GLC54960.1 hypothetical protein PLESTB_000925100 [Pleodorina starrii]GLC68477.1 hypothetical protein PLESTF_000695700 [Pleodorina starrii]
MVADKAIVSSLSGDPRRPDSVVPYPQRVPSEEPKIDAYATAGMLLGSLGMLTRVRILSFVALAFIASAFVQRGPDTDTKQIFVSGMMSLMGIFVQHMAPLGAANANANATQAVAAPAAAAGAVGGQA